MVNGVLPRAVERALGDNRYERFRRCLEEVFGLSRDDVESLWEAAQAAWGPLGAASLYSRFYLPLRMCAEHVDYGRSRDWARIRREILGLKKIILTNIIKKSRYTQDRRRLVEYRLKMVEEALSGAGYLPLTIRFRFTSRAMIGRPPPPFTALFEGGTAMDPVLEVPYIPGSSFKGLLRMVYSGIGSGLRCLGEIGEPVLFGSKSAGKGAIVVTDAYPAPDAGIDYLLDGDVTTPIYADGTPTPRIEEHKARPVPSTYPVVRSGVVFVEVLGIKRDMEDACKEDILELMKGFFALASSVGIGRKVSLGYGNMLVIG